MMLLMNSAQTKKATKTIELRDLRDRDYTRFGRKYIGRTSTGQHATIAVGESIRIFGIYGRDTTYDRTFRLGDFAEYDSYNMAYTGKIVSIGEKTIGIEDGGKVHLLLVFDFARRNQDLDLEAIAARNFDVMMHC